MCVCVYIALGHTFALFWWSGHKVDTDSGQTPSPSLDTPSVGLGGTWHFQEIPMNHSTNRQALMLGDLYGTPQCDCDSVCKQKSLKFHELYAVSLHERVTSRVECSEICWEFRNVQSWKLSDWRCVLWTVIQFRRESSNANRGKSIELTGLYCGYCQQRCQWMLLPHAQTHSYSYSQWVHSYSHNYSDTSPQARSLGERVNEWI